MINSNKPEENPRGDPLQLPAAVQPPLLSTCGSEARALSSPGKATLPGARTEGSRARQGHPALGTQEGRVFQQRQWLLLCTLRPQEETCAECFGLFNLPHRNKIQRGSKLWCLLYQAYFWAK